MSNESKTLIFIHTGGCELKQLCSIVVKLMTLLEFFVIFVMQSDKRTEITINKKKKMYRKSDIIGYGTGSIVYKIHKTFKGVEKSLAMKVVDKKSRRGRKMGLRLLKEAETLRDISHPNVVSFYGYSITPEENCLLMEELDQSLGDHMEKLKEIGSSCLPPRDVFLILEGVSRALAYLHYDKIMVHGDIKSYNVLIRDNMRTVKICDFGLSMKLKPDGIKGVEDFVGTLCWTAPEVISGTGPISSKVDIFSLGLVVYEMLTLKLPLFYLDYMKGETNSCNTRHNKGVFNEVKQELIKSMEDRFYSFIEIFNWCCEEDYNDRPNVKDLIQVLESGVFNIYKLRSTVETRRIYT